MADDWRYRWDAAEAQWVLDQALGIDVASVATEAPVAGWDSPLLRLLPFGARDDPRDLRDLFDGRVEPYPGARAIARIGYRDDLGEDALLEIATFSALEDEWAGGWGRSRRAVESDIRNEAGKVASR